MKKGYISASSAVLNDGEYLNLAEHVDVKKNKTLIFTARVSEFSALRIGHGETSYSSSYLDIDQNDMRVSNFYREEAPAKAEAHGLQIESYITVVIKVDILAEITLFTASGCYTMSDVPWSGCNGALFAKSEGTKLTDCELKWTCSDLTCPVWVFGDSYLGLTSYLRFPYYILKLGYKNWLACGYPGAGARSQMLCFENLLKLGTPKVAVWCLGMNNNDLDGLNTSWKESTEVFLKLCEQNDITPILSTIPTTWHKNEDGTLSVVRENRPKNEWVKSSGCRYVDFDKAVGADSGTGWYEGMLYSDDVHPAETGAQALANRFVVDVPEIAW